MKFYILDGGHLGPYNKSSFILGRGKGEKIILPVWQAYIEHPRAKILIDTGINPQTDMLPGFGREVHQSEDQRIENQLARIGVIPEEIDIVINTHLHYDHTAANHLFKQAVFIVQKAEMRYAYAPEWYEASYYQPISHFAIPDLNYKLIEGDFEVFEGVQILFTPGHTPGSQSVLIRTENPGPFLIAGDAAYLQENLEDLSRYLP